MISALLAPAMKYLCGGLLFLTVILGIALKVERVHSRHLSDRVAQLTSLRAQDRANYEAAQKAAKALNDATLARVKAEQEHVTHEVSSDYQRQLADLRLRAQPKANPGQPGGPKAPSVRGPTGGSDGTDQLRVPSEGLLRAQEIELQLMKLQDWIIGQSGVDPNSK